VVKDKSDKYIVRSVRVPENLWNLLKRISSSGYRPVNSQLIKVLEDWLVDHGYINNEERSRFED
tara:strand:- start:208 stop:399 length:192 start_codon:yes stop_codon:yes gene_type:complete